MKFEQFDYVVSDHLVTAITYGDISGLSYEEISILEEFLVDAWVYAKDYFPNATHYHWEVGDSVGFIRCNITELYSDCVELKMMIAIKE